MLDRCLFPAMISYWRREFKLPDLPFFYVLLAAGHTALLREAQYLGAAAINNTAFASAVDLGASAGEYLIPGHPPRKQEVGRRLALVNRARVYHETGVDDRGPRVLAEKVTVTSVTDTKSGAVHTTVVIPFDVGTDGHLHLNGTGGCTACCNGSSATILAADMSMSNPSSPVGLLDPAAATTAAKLYKTQTFTVDAAAAVLTATIPGWHASTDVAEVQFLFDNFPQCAVYSGELSGPDAVYATVQHFGLVAESWRGNVTVKKTTTTTSA